MKRFPATACVALFFLLAVFLTGCLGEPPVNTDWATPAGAGVSGNGDGIQDALSAYAQALVDKDRDKFASTLDAANTSFAAAELQKFDNLRDVPFDRYVINLSNLSEAADGTVTAKVTSGYTLRDSFPELPDLDRAAYFLINRGDGWKISGDASVQALGKPREARFEDFGKVEVLNSGRAIVLFQEPQRETAIQALTMVQSALPRLEEVVPGTSLPKVPVRVYAGITEINQTFPGKWQEWTGGASRQLGEKTGQGGEIIIDAQVFIDTNRTTPGYNQKMMAHELTHISLFPLTGNRTPPFLIEGMADYVAGIEDVVLLKERLRAGGAYSPTLRDLYQPGSFTVLLNTDAATLAYEEADTAVALLEQKYGNERVMSLLREFQRHEQDKQSQDVIVDDVFRSGLRTGWNDFENEWRAFVLGN